MRYIAPPILPSVNLLVAIQQSHKATRICTLTSYYGAEAVGSNQEIESGFFTRFRPKFDGTITIVIDVLDARIYNKIASVLAGNINQPLI